MPPAVEIVGHRGCRDGAPEHTLAAYRSAIAAGADALECDVRLSADGHLVCLHDRRLDLVSDARGLVSTMTLAELRQVRFEARRAWRVGGRWRRGSGPTSSTELESDPAAHTMVSLRDLLELVAAAPRPIGLTIETKHPTRFGGLVEARLVGLLSEFGLAAQRLDAHGRPAVRVMSFSAAALRRTRRLAPSLDLVYLMGRLPRRYRAGTLPPGVRTAGINVEIVRSDPGYVGRAQARGHRVAVWTVNEPADVEACLAAGVDTLITDRPRAVRRQVFAQQQPEG